MARKFHVTADHRLGQYHMNDIIELNSWDNAAFRVLSININRGTAGTGYYAIGHVFGCGKTFSNPNDAIFFLLHDNGCTNIRIEEIKTPARKVKRETEWFSLSDIATGRHLGYVEAVSERAAKIRGNKMFPMHHGYIGVRSGITSEELTSFGFVIDTSEPPLAIEPARGDVRDPCGNIILTDDPDYTEAVATMAAYRKAHPELSGITWAEMWVWDAQRHDDPAVQRPDILPHPSPEQTAISHAHAALRRAVALAETTPVEGELFNSNYPFWSIDPDDFDAPIFGHGNEFSNIVNWELRAEADEAVRIHSDNPTFVSGCNVRMLATQCYILRMIDVFLYEAALSWSFMETPPGVEGEMQTRTVELHALFSDYYDDDYMGPVMGDVDYVNRFTWSPSHLSPFAPIIGKPFSATLNLSSL